MVLMEPKRGRPKGTKLPATDRRVTITIRLHPDVIEAIEKLVKHERSTRTMVLSAAIKEHLSEAGFWPKDPEPEG